MTRYWLMKSEPDEFSIADLEREKVSFWNGVRNYQARNHMMNDMRVGDKVLFYHSSAKPTGVAGIAVVASEAEPDATAWDPENPYFDEKSIPEKPRWYGVKVRFERALPRFVDLDAIKKEPKLKNMVLLQNSRLSVQPVTKEEFNRICELGER